MIDLDFAVREVVIAARTATPLLLFKLRIATVGATEAIDHVTLQAQLRIEAPRRAYNGQERERLVELFGAAADWDRNLRGLLWATVNVAVPAFTGETNVDLPVPCSSDFTIAATKYFHGIETGEVPLLLLFSGAVFFRNRDGDLQIGQIAHHKEAQYRFPVRLWHEAMARHYGGRVWLSLDQDTFDELYRFRREAGCSTFEDALRRLLRPQVEEVRR